ncbi:MAG: hypothetical protein ACFCU8_03905 [Thermosynechococcaceae cyanobacterium]
MRVISRSRLLEFTNRHRPAAEALDIWYRLAKKAGWQNLSEVRETFRSEQDNETALATVAELAHRDNLTQAEEDLMELLTQLIERFEEEHYAFPEDMAAQPLDFLLD